MTKKAISKTVANVWSSLQQKRREFLSRRPHRSFQLSRRRDSQRSLGLPGYIQFTLQTWRTMWRHKRVFFGLAFIYFVLMTVLGNITTQATYAELRDAVDGVMTDVAGGDTSSLGRAGLVSLAVFGAGGGNLSDLQQAYVALVGLLAWLGAIWLLREVLAGNSPTLRDGLYRSASPLVPTLLIAMIALVQLIPVALIALAYASLTAAGIVDGGLGSMLFFGVAALVVSLTLYWMTATFMALVVVTLPGMYPLQAMKVAGDLVVGRRMGVLFRVLWMMAVAFLVWLAIIVPLIILESLIANPLPWVASLPIVPIAISLLGSVTIVWGAIYIYMMYRKMLDDD